MKLNYFLRTAFTGAFALTAIFAHAQDLSRKIPADALAVITVKGDNLTQLMAIKEFDTTFLGKKIIEKLSKESDGKINSVEGLGFNLASTFYYYNQTNDSVTYNCFLAPLKNAADVDRFFTLAKMKFVTQGKLRISSESNSSLITYWNDEMLLCVMPDGKSNYFSRPDVRARFGLSMIDTGLDVLTDSTTSVVMSDTTYTETVPVVTTTEAGTITIDGAADIAPKKAPVQVKKVTKTKSNLKVKGKKSAKKSNIKKPAKKKPIDLGPEPVYTNADIVVADNVPVTDMEAPVDSAGVSSPVMEGTYFKDDQTKKGVVAGWANAMINDLFAKTDQPSILTNADFVKSVDQNAEMTFWTSGADKLVNAYLPLDIFKGMNLLNGYGSANAKIYLENNLIRIKSAMTFSPEMAATFKKVQKRKLNKQFLNYVNEDKMIGYMAYAADTKAYLQEYPKIMANLYGTIYKDEISLGADLFSLLLDEEAISKVIKGDAMFVFNGLSQKEVSYKSYDYNEENFETKEVMKTKQETLPDFLFMLSTEDTRLIDKLIAYGVKREVIKNNQRYYEVVVPQNPLGLYFTIKNGIIFIGTNSTEIEQIASNSFRSNLSSRSKKALTGVNYAGYFSPKKLAGKIPSNEIGANTLDKANRILNSMGDIYMKSNPVSGNTFSGEVSMDIPAGQKNALKYLFSIVTDAQK